MVYEAVRAHKLTILCLQETKIDAWTPALVRDIGGRSLDGCAALPSIGTHGGAAIFWDSSVVGLATHMVGCFSITAEATMLHSSSAFWLTTDYGPADEARKDDFLHELATAAPPQGNHG